MDLPQRIKLAIYSFSADKTGIHVRALNSNQSQRIDPLVSNFYEDEGRNEGLRLDSAPTELRGLVSDCSES